MGTVYILHSDKRIGSGKQSARHYAGYTKRKFDIRKDEHLNSNDIPIINAFRNAGATFRVGKIFQNVDRIFERYLKRTNKRLDSFCLVCREEKIIKEQIGVTNMENEVHTKYYVCGISDDCGQTIMEKPFICNSTELHKQREQAKEYTDGNLDVVVLHEFTVKHCGNGNSQPPAPIAEVLESYASVSSEYEDIPF